MILPAFGVTIAAFDAAGTALPRAGVGEPARGEILNDTGVRHLRVKVDKKGSKFASLIDRLSGKK